MLIVNVNIAEDGKRQLEAVVIGDKVCVLEGRRGRDLGIRAAAEVVDPKTGLRGATLAPDQLERAADEWSRSFQNSVTQFVSYEKFSGMRGEDGQTIPSFSPVAGGVMMVVNGRFAVNPVEIRALVATKTNLRGWYQEEINGIPGLVAEIV